MKSFQNQNLKIPAMKLPPVVRPSAIAVSYYLRLKINILRPYGQKNAPLVTSFPRGVVQKAKTQNERNLAWSVASYFLPLLPHFVSPCCRQTTVDGTFRWLLVRRVDAHRGFSFLHRSKCAKCAKNMPSQWRQGLADWQTLVLKIETLLCKKWF